MFALSILFSFESIDWLAGLVTVWAAGRMGNWPARWPAVLVNEWISGCLAG